MYHKFKDTPGIRTGGIYPLVYGHHSVMDMAAARATSQPEGLLANSTYC